MMGRILSENQKIGIVKLWEKKLSNKEISQVLDINESTVGGFTYILNAIKKGRDDAIMKAFNASRTQGRVKWICDFVGYDLSKLQNQTEVKETTAGTSEDRNTLSMQDSTFEEQLATQCSAINQALTKILECWGADIEDRKKGGF